MLASLDLADSHCIVYPDADEEVVWLSEHAVFFVDIERLIARELPEEHREAKDQLVEVLGAL